jgi:succinyl-diaminopimelate desuccinylase
LLKATHPSGTGIGIHGRDEETGDLTSNAGVFVTKGERVHISYSIRYPVTWTAEYLQSRLDPMLQELGWNKESFRDSRGLYFPLDHPLVKTIVQAYTDETGEKLLPDVMGGGTYARAIPNSVSIGTSWPELGDGVAHETDERIFVQSLYKSARIYARIFLGLIRHLEGQG